MLTFALIFAVATGLLFWIGDNPSRIIYLLPVLLGFEFRVRASSFSIDLSELSILIVAVVWMMRAWQGKLSQRPGRERFDLWLILGLVVFAFPATFLESNIMHAASAYRDLVLPFLFFLVFLQARLEKREVHLLIKLACIFGLANAGMGIIQHLTGQYLWFVGPDEADWQAYKTGFARLSIFGEFFGVQDTLPVGLYDGTNSLGFYLALPLCLTTTLAFSKEVAKPKRRLWQIASVVMLICLILTMFRSGLLVYVISMLTVYLILSRSHWIVRGGIVTTLVGLLTVSVFLQGLFDWDQFGTLEGRQEMISDALTLIKAHPDVLLTGGYTDRYHALTRATQEIHNAALFLIVQFGLPATALFFAFFIRFFRRVALAANLVTGQDRSAIVAITVSIGVNVLLYGSTTMLGASVQETIWLLFWVGITRYLIVYSKTRVTDVSFDGVPRRPTTFPGQRAHA